MGSEDGGRGSENTKHLTEQWDTVLSIILKASAYTAYGYNRKGKVEGDSFFHERQLKGHTKKKLETFKSIGI